MDRAVAMNDTIRAAVARHPKPLKTSVWYQLSVAVPASGNTFVWIDGERVAVVEPPGDDDPSRPRRAASARSLRASRCGLAESA